MCDIFINNDQFKPFKLLSHLLISDGSPHQQVPAGQTLAYPIENTPNTRGEVLQTAVLGLTRVVTKVRMIFSLEDIKKNNIFRMISMWSGSG